MRREAIGLEAFEAALEGRAGQSGSGSVGWRADLVRLAPGERGRFVRLCREHGIEVLDTLNRQLADLVRARDPGAGEAERAVAAATLVSAAGDAGAFGVWTHFPWLHRVVHLLGPEEHFELITDRNRDKITREEQALLRTKKVGVMGLSVGGEAAVTVAQEHLCGELRLADFDDLDLSNLNRLGAGVDELGRNKATIVARRIALFDPFLEVRVFDRGVDPESAGEFLDGLDLLLEECDDLRMKFLVREEARRRGLDLVYAGDERGFLSVEPYKSRPDLAPFHGRVEAPPLPREAYSSPVAFFRTLTEWLGGWEAISERSRRSLERIGADLCGYPQLAGEARYAAGQVAHAARRLLLGEPLPPFVGQLALEELLGR